MGVPLPGGLGRGEELGGAGGGAGAVVGEDVDAFEASGSGENGRGAVVDVLVLGWYPERGAAWLWRPRWCEALFVDQRGVLLFLSCFDPILHSPLPCVVL